MQTKLIILRGPPGSGKSTVAKQLVEQSDRKIAMVELDVFRHLILDEQEGAREVSAKMVYATIVAALDGGYDVIAEGIFNVKHYKQMFDNLLQYHPEENFIYYFDISFEESVKRHETREKRHDFSVKDMEKWYTTASPIEYEHEKKLAEDLTLEATVAQILSETSL